MAKAPKRKRPHLVRLSDSEFQAVKDARKRYIEDRINEEEVKIDASSVAFGAIIGAAVTKWLIDLKKK